VLQLPFLAELKESRRVLLAGAGGGFDVFCGLPLYFALRDASKQVFLANLSFTLLPGVGANQLAPALYEVTADTPGPEHINYFPEGYLCRWFRSVGQEVALYSFERSGVTTLRAGYEELQRRLGFDTLVLIDGGTDSLMRGDEEGLGTPVEDIASILAVHGLNIANKYLVCLGFGVDAYHGVCHAHFLEAVAELTRAGGLLGVFSLLEEMVEVKLYRQASDAVFAAMPGHPSIVSTSILSALEGRYGDYHATGRTRGSTLYINPLMALYWCFRLGPVAQRILYREQLESTTSCSQVAAVIQRFRETLPALRAATVIPL
jgi:hypothetical protein